MRKYSRVLHREDGDSVTVSATKTPDGSYLIRETTRVRSHTNCGWHTRLTISVTNIGTYEDEYEAKTRVDAWYRDNVA